MSIPPMAPQSEHVTSPNEQTVKYDLKQSINLTESQQAIMVQEINDDEPSTSTGIVHKRNPFSLKRGVEFLTFPSEIPHKKQCNFSDKKEYAPTSEYIERLKILEQKELTTLECEIQAVCAFKGVLNKSIPIQKRLAELSNEELVIFLPIFFTQASNSIDPIIKMNNIEMFERELFCETSIPNPKNTNLGLIESLTQLLNFFNNFYSGIFTHQNTKQILSDFLKNTCHKITSLSDIYLINFYRSDEYKNEMRHILNNFQCYPKNKFYELIRHGGQTNIILRQLNETIKACMGETLPYSEKRTLVLHGVKQHYDKKEPTKRRDIIIDALSELLVSAIDNYDILKLYQITTEFALTNILPYGIKRLSDVIRAAFLLATDNAPAFSLTPYSHYSAIDIPMNLAHIQAMQNITLSILEDLEQKQLSIDRNRIVGIENTEELIEKYNLTSDYAKWDAKCFMDIINESPRDCDINHQVLKWIQKYLPDNIGQEFYNTTSELERLSIYQNRHKSCKEYYPINKSNESMLIFAIKNKHSDIVQSLINCNFDINRITGRTTPLIYAIEQKNKETIEILMFNTKIDVNVTANRSNALLTAVKLSDTDTIKLIFTKTLVNVNETDISGNSSLLIAVSNQNTETVKLLLEVRDIDVNLQNYNGETPFILAAKLANRAICLLLLEQPNLDINAVDLDNQTAVDYMDKAFKMSILQSYQWQRQYRLQSALFQ